MLPKPVLHVDDHTVVTGEANNLNKDRGGVEEEKAVKGLTVDKARLKDP